jgi:cytochrome c553
VVHSRFLYDHTKEQALKVSRWYSLVLVCGGIFAAATLRAEAPSDRGKKLFNLCSQCHGDAGEGNPKLAAPAIAGLEEWYVSAQLKKFHDGARGKHPRDDAGNRMRPMALTLKTKDGGDDIAAVAAYVGSLPRQTPVALAPVGKTPASHVLASPRSVKGDATKGRDLYAVCVACHGDKGQGNKLMNAPALAQLDDWYMLTQLKNFKGGLRGADAALDPQGALMVPMAKNLKDEQAMLDVITYIKTFAPGEPAP